MVKSQFIVVGPREFIFNSKQIFFHLVQVEHPFIQLFLLENHKTIFSLDKIVHTKTHLTETAIMADIGTTIYVHSQP